MSNSPRTDELVRELKRINASDWTIDLIALAQSLEHKLAQLREDNRRLGENVEYHHIDAVNWEAKYWNMRERAVRAESGLTHVPGDWEYDALKDELRDTEVELRRARAERDSLQAWVDALMMEHCPNEMTPEQVSEWSKHQVAVPMTRDEIIAGRHAGLQEE
jgi:hypothetical protein